MTQSMANTPTNPFDDEDGIFRVLVNAEGEHSLWPATINVPAGWSAVHGPGRRADCLAYVSANWQDDHHR